MEIARGEIDISLNDTASREIQAVEARYRAAMATIDRMEATAKVKADTSNIEAKLKKAKDDLRQLNGEKASVKVGADTTKLDAEIAKARAAVKQLDGQKAKIQIDTRDLEVALAKTEALRRAESARATAADRYAKQAEDAAARAANLANVQKNAANQQQVLDARKNVQIAQMMVNYAKLTDEIEKADKAAKKFKGPEMTAKLDQNRTLLLAQMELLKAQLNEAGKHPPVKIKVDTDTSDLSRLRRTLNAISGIAGKGLEKFSNIGDVRVFGNSLATLASVGAALAPILVSVAGAATSLVAVLGAGLAGAGAVAGGVLTGLATNFLGVKFALANTIQDFSLAEKSVTAYHVAIAKYGEKSKQATQAQAVMNSVLSETGPTVRKAAVEFAGLKDQWQQLTGATAQRSFGTVLSSGFEALHRLLPTFAKNTNATFGVVTQAATTFSKSLSSPGGIKIFDSLGKSANQFLAPALKGVEALAHAFLHVGESAARIFGGQAGKGLENFAKSLERASEPGGKLDHTIRTLGNDAKDIIHLFGAAGRIIATLFKGAAPAGDGMVQSLTRVINKWNEFLRSTKGQSDMRDFFARSAKDASALAGALAPIIGIIVQWANLLAPFTTGLLQGVAFVAKLLAGITKVLALGGPLGALGTTIGVIFAVSKVGAFLNVVQRIALAMREAAKAGGALGLLKFAAGGGLFGKGAAAAGAAEPIIAAGETAAAAMGAAIAEGGAVAAGEIRAAMGTGGLAAGAETAAGGLLRGAAPVAAGVAGAEVAGAGAAVAGTEAAAGAATALGVSAGVATGGLALLAAAAVAVGYKLLSAKSSMDATNASFNLGKKFLNDYQAGFQQVTSAATDAHAALNQANLDVQQARKGVAETVPGTLARKQAELGLAAAYRNRYTAQRDATTADTSEQEHNIKAVSVGQAKLALYDKTHAAEIAQLKNTIQAFPHTIAAAAAEKQLASIEADRVAAVNQLNAALNRQAAETSNVAREIKGMIPLTAAADQALGKLARNGPGGLGVAPLVATKYNDPNQVRDVANSANKALSGGVSAQRVLKIIADTKSADQAIARLNSAALHDKNLRIYGSTGAAVAATAKVNGIKISPKTLRLLHEGDPETINRIRFINMMKLLDKITKLTAQDNASPVIAGLNAAIAAIQRTVTITTNLVTHGSPAPQPGLHGGAILATGTSPYSPSPIVPFAQGGTYPRATGMRVTKPTLLTGEEGRPEYVIATNPAYRRRNSKFLAQAAGDFGYQLTDKWGYPVEAHAKGKAPAKKPTVAPGHSTGPQAGPVPVTNLGKLSVPDPYRAAGVPTAELQTALDHITSELSGEQTTLRGILNQLDKTHVPGVKRNKKGKPTNLAQIAKTSAAIKDLLAGKNALERGGTYHRKKYDSVAQLAKDKRDANYDLIKLNDANAQIDHLNSVIGIDETKMGTFSTQYSTEAAKKNPNTQNIGRIKGGWQVAHDDRLTQLAALTSRLTAARGVAAEVVKRFGKYANADDYQKFLDGLDQQIAQANDATANTEGATAPGDTGAGVTDFASFLASTGQQGTLDTLNENFALAQTNNVSDGAGGFTTASLSDDASSAYALQQFYGGELTAAQAAGEPANVITEAANNYTTAKAAYQNIADTISGTSTAAAANAQQAQQQSNQYAINYSTGRNDLYTNYASNVWATPSPSGIGGYGQPTSPTASASGTTNVTVNNTFPTPPPDPHTFSQGLSWELQAAI